MKEDKITDAKFAEILLSQMQDDLKGISNLKRTGRPSFDELQLQAEISPHYKELAEVISLSTSLRRKAKASLARKKCPEKVQRRW